MLKLLRGAECYSPEHLGIQDILTAYGKILMIAPHIPTDNFLITECVDLYGSLVCPGWIDGHVHLSGGGGEQGPSSSIGPLPAVELLGTGITTVVGLLGADAIGKSMRNLVLKAYALETEGLTAFLYTGHYGLPPVTITESALTDIVLIEKVLGIGEIAISDHRSAHPTQQELKKLAYEAHTGGMLSGKAGILHLHVGNGKEGLRPLIGLLDNSDFPSSMFIPTHVNRSAALFRQAMNYHSFGGNIDLTAGEESVDGIRVPEALQKLLESGSGLDRVTVSSDGNGGGAGASGTEKGRVAALPEDIRRAVLELKLPLETVLRTVTTNAADVLRLSPGKGRLTPGSDADILVLDETSLELQKVYSGGELRFEAVR